MAKSAYEYVKQFELADKLLPGCWIVVRVDGKGFTRCGNSSCAVGVKIQTWMPAAIPQSHARVPCARFCEDHGFEKPNDERALALMDDAALAVMAAFPDVRLAFGESDEYSFVLAPSSKLYGAWLLALKWVEWDGAGRWSWGVPARSTGQGGSACACDQQHRSPCLQAGDRPSWCPS